MPYFLKVNSNVDTDKLKVNVVTNLEYNEELKAFMCPRNEVVFEEREFSRENLLDEFYSHELANLNADSIDDLLNFQREYGTLVSPLRGRFAGGIYSLDAPYFLGTTKLNTESGIAEHYDPHPEILAIEESMKLYGKAKADEPPSLLPQLFRIGNFASLNEVQTTVRDLQNVASDIVAVVKAGQGGTEILTESEVGEHKPADGTDPLVFSVQNFNNRIKVLEHTSYLSICMALNFSAISFEPKNDVSNEYVSTAVVAVAQLINDVNKTAPYKVCANDKCTLGAGGTRMVFKNQRGGGGSISQKFCCYQCGKQFHKRQENARNKEKRRKAKEQRASKKGK